MNRKRFFDGIRRSPFSGLNQKQVDGLNFLLDAFEKYKVTDPRWQAYILATIKHETAHTMQPIAEYGGPRKRYAPWYGRGYVQLTWKANYVAFQKEVKELFNVDIVANANNAMIPEVSAYISIKGMERGTFTGKKLSDYLNTRVTDYVGARRIINGTDKAQQIAAIAQAFYTDILAAKEQA